MAKKPKPPPRRPAQAAEASRLPAAGLAGAAVAALAACAFWWSRARGAAPAGETGAEGVGPQSMQGTQPLVNRLLELMQEVEQIKGQAERRKASVRVERELNEIEAKLGGGTDAVAKQSAALISVVRSAIAADKEGSDKWDNWNDAALVEEHGLVTYASKTYWDEAYADKRYGDSYDWYGAWAEKGLSGQSIGDVVRPVVAKDAKILVLGCGNSNMSVLMHEEGYRDITNVDIAEPVIAQMRESYGHIDGLKWHAMDASALALADGSFDAVIEKGLFDALFAGTGALTEKVLAEVQRVLRPGGSLVSITFSGQRLKDLFHGPEGETAEAAAGGLTCDVKGQIQYPKARSTHGEKSGELAFSIYKCTRP